MEKYIIKKENLSKEFELEILEDFLYLTIENKKLQCNLINNNNVNALKFWDHYDFTFIKKCNGISITSEDAKNIKLIQENLKKLNNEKQVENFKNQKTISYNTSYDFLLPSCISNNYSKQAIRLVYEQLQETKKLIETDCGDYSITDTFEVSGEELLKMLDDAETKTKSENEIKKANKEKEIKAIFDKAKATGEKQLLNKWSEDCNDKNEDCDIDIIYEYAMPDGTVKTERHHTW